MQWTTADWQYQDRTNSRDMAKQTAVVGRRLLPGTGALTNLNRVALFTLTAETLTSR